MTEAKEQASLLDNLIDDLHEIVVNTGETEWDCDDAEDPQTRVYLSGIFSPETRTQVGTAITAYTSDLVTAARLALALLSSRDTGGIIEGIAIEALRNAITKAEAAQ